MPRPAKCRRVCSLPKACEFAPKDKSGKQAVVITVDEYETLRLIDNEGFSQEQCGEYMNIARTTVQQIYASARKKIARAIVEARPFVIKDGSYTLCGGKEERCWCGGCKKQSGACLKENNL